MKTVMGKKQQQGAISALTAFGVFAILGAAALAVDVGYFYREMERAQSAADYAALAAMQEYLLNGGKNVDDAQVAAENSLTINGFMPIAKGGLAKVVINIPPTNSKSHKDDPNYAEVGVTIPRPDFFFGTLKLPYFEVTRWSVAGLGGVGSISGGGGVDSSNCLMVGGNTHLEKSGWLTGPKCRMYFGGKLENEGDIEVKVANKKDGKKFEGTVDSAMTEPADPSFPVDAKFTSCGSNKTCSGKETINPGCYDSITVTSSGDCTFLPGEYFIKTNMNAGKDDDDGKGKDDNDGNGGNGAKLAGTNVVFYIKGDLEISGKPVLTGGGPGGLLFYVKGDSMKFGNGNGNKKQCDLTGMIYAPNAEFHVVNKWTLCPPGSQITLFE